MGFNFKSIDVGQPKVDKYLGVSSSNTNYEKGPKSMNVESVNMENANKSNVEDFQVADTGLSSCYIQMDYAPNIVPKGDYMGIDGDYDKIIDIFGGQLDDHNNGASDYTYDIEGCDDYVRAYALYLQTGKIPSKDSVGVAPEGMSVETIEADNRKDQAQRAFDIVNDEGRPCIIHVCSGTGNGHWLCVVGYKNEATRENVSIGDLLVIDPAGRFDGDVSAKVRPVSEDESYCLEGLDECFYEPGYQILSYKKN